jgi:tetratricopeptide (TPR) repeat protein
MKAFYKSLIISILCISNVTAQYETESTTDFSFKDVFSFTTADSMYMVADTLPYSSNTTKIIKLINRNINYGNLLETNRVWNELLKLEPYRMHPKMEGEVSNIVEKYTALVEKKKQRFQNPISIKEIKESSSFYSDGDFETFIDLGRKLLVRDPYNSDIRSNLALALMHSNKDLCAWIELETVRKFDSLHIPALINLTVVYERLGMREDAENLANHILDLHYTSFYNFPQTIYNVAWFYFSREQYLKVDSILSRIEYGQDKIYPNILNLKKLNHLQIREYLKGQSILDVGIIGKLGYYAHCSSAGWYIFFFIIASIIVLIGIPLLFYWRYKKHGFIYKHPKFMSFSVAMLNPAFYTLAWGVQTGRYWLLPSLFYILLLIILLLIDD